MHRMRAFICWSCSLFLTYICLLIHRDTSFAGCRLRIFNLCFHWSIRDPAFAGCRLCIFNCLYWLIHKRPFLCLMSSLHCSPGPPPFLPGWGGWSSGGGSWNWPGPSVSAVQMSKRIKEMCRTGRVFAFHFRGLDVWLLCTHRKLFYCIFFRQARVCWPLLSLCVVAHYVILRDVWVRTKRAAFASRCGTNLAMHPSPWS